MKRGVPQPLLRAWARARELGIWWLSELRDMGAQLMQRLPSRRSPQVFIRVAGGVMSVERREANDWIVVGTVPAAADGSWPVELPGLPPELAGSRACIIVPESELFFCQFELPTAIERQLNSVVRLQLERALPVALEQVLFDRQIVSRDREHMTVRVAVAHRERVEQLRDTVTRWALAPVCTGVVNEQGAVLFNFLKRRRDPLRWMPSRQEQWLLRAAAAGVGLLAIVLGSQWMRERYVVTDSSAELHAQAVRLTGERTALQEAAKPLQALQEIAGTRDAPAVLATLSSAMPMGSWFTHIEIVTHVDASGRLALTGPVVSRAEATKALAAVPGVHNLKTSSAFSGEVAGPEVVEFTADFDANQKRAAPL